MRLHTINIQRMRYQYHLAQLVKRCFWMCLAIVIGVAAYYLAQGYLWAANEAQNAVKQAEIERDSALLSNQELLQVLSGRMVMVNPLGGEYQEFATVTWTLAEVGK